MNQEEFAKEIGVSVTSVFHWETGKAIPDRNDQYKIYKFCCIHELDVSNEIEKEIQSEKGMED